MDARALRQTFLWLFVGFLGFSALVAIGAVLTGDFGELQVRILGSSGTVSAASVCALACAAFRERPRGRGLGTVGIGLAIAAAAAVLLLIWGDFDNKTQVRWTMTLVVYAAATAHAELLWLPRLQASHRWAQFAVVGAIGLLAALLTVVILGEVGDNDALLRVMVVIAILTALLTLVVPILWKIGAAGAGPGAAAETRLVLRREPDGRWVDEAGARYEVRRVDLP